MFKIIQELSYTRYVTNVIQINEETCERWTKFAEDWGVTWEDGSKIIFTPELVEENWGKRDLKIKGNLDQDTHTLFDLMHEMAADDFQEERFDYQNDDYDNGDEEWYTERD